MHIFKTFVFILLILNINLFLAISILFLLIEKCILTVFDVSENFKMINKFIGII
jgi:hypothetical protein